MFGLFILKMDEVLFYVVHNDTHEAFESPSKSLLCYLLSYYVMVSFKQFLLPLHKRKFLATCNAEQSTSFQVIPLVLITRSCGAQCSGICCDSGLEQDK